MKMICCVYFQSRRVRHFLLWLPIFSVLLYYFLLNTQALMNRRFLLFENGIFKENDTAAPPHGVMNDSIDEVLVFTLFARLSSEMENKMKTIDFLISGFKNNISGSRLCPIISPKLIGWTNISEAAILEEKDDALQYEMRKNRVEKGGKYEPAECQSRHKLAIVIPIRNRTKHLGVFSRYMHRFLQRQELSYAIFVVEQSEGLPFNRGMLMNIGFNEAQQQQLRDKFQCFFFHDVDLLPEHDGNPYTCPEDGKPRLMSYSIDIWDNYKPCPDWYFGGVTALSTNDFRLVNGFSNVYWGWGGEDDDLLQRVKHHNMTVTRTLQDYPSLVHMVHYKSLSHAKAEPNPMRFKLLKEGPNRMTYDGLNDLKYKTVNIQRELLYTYIRVDIKQDSSHVISTTSAIG